MRMTKGKRWVAAGVLAVVLAVVVAWVLFVPAADWLARHDIGHATGTSLETARNNARGNLLALTAGLAGFGALLFTVRNFALQRRTLQLSEEGQRRTHELTELAARLSAELCVQSERVAGSPNRGRMAGSKRVMAQIWVPERVMTISPIV